MVAVGRLHALFTLLKNGFMLYPNLIFLNWRKLSLARGKMKCGRQHGRGIVFPKSMFGVNGAMSSLLPSIWFAKF